VPWKIMPSAPPIIALVMMPCRMRVPKRVPAA